MPLLKIGAGIFLFGVSMMKTDGPFRTCVYMGAMLARDRFKKKSIIKITKIKRSKRLTLTKIVSVHRIEIEVN